jgi:hypothetical protein
LRTPDATAVVDEAEVVPEGDVEPDVELEAAGEADVELEHAARPPSASTLATDVATARLIRMHSP